MQGLKKSINENYRKNKRLGAEEYNCVNLSHIIKTNGAVGGAMGMAD